jgi:hypothetical protein
LSGSGGRPKNNDLDPVWVLEVGHGPGRVRVCLRGYLYGFGQGIGERVPRVYHVRLPEKRKRMERSGFEPIRRTIQSFRKMGYQARRSAAVRAWRGLSLHLRSNRSFCFFPIPVPCRCPPSLACPVTLSYLPLSSSLLSSAFLLCPLLSTPHVTTPPWRFTLA